MNINTSYFDGNIFQLIIYRVIAFLVIVLTGGICLPWAVCIMKSWETKHTVINGHRLAFDGNGMQLFGNYVKWWILTLVTFGIYVFWLEIKLKQWVVKHTYMVD